MVNYWWKVIEDECPISLQTIKEMPYPPFVVTEGGAAAYYDGKFLAQYLIASGTFVSPTTRSPFTREQCVELDYYCMDHDIRLNNTVTDSFDLLHSLDSEAPQARRLQREARQVLQALFTFQRQGRGRRPPGRRSLMREAEVQQSIESGVSLDLHISSQPEEFPALSSRGPQGGGNTQRVSSVYPGVGRPPNVAGEEEFPPLPGASQQQRRTPSSAYRPAPRSSRRVSRKSTQNELRGLAFKR